jgi:hypothetical protein
MKTNSITMSPTATVSITKNRVPLCVVATEDDEIGSVLSDLRSSTNTPPPASILVPVPSISIKKPLSHDEARSTELSVATAATEETHLHDHEHETRMHHEQASSSVKTDTDTNSNPGFYHTQQGGLLLAPKNMPLRVDEYVVPVVSSPIREPKKSCLKRESSYNSLGQSSGTSRSLGASGKKRETATRPVSPATSARELKRTSSTVSFQSVNVREYERTLGDNPSCSYGPPVTLDWEYSNEQSISLDDYEKYRGMRRNKCTMRLPARTRETMLKINMGFSDEEVQAVEKAIKKVQKSRSMTDVFSPFWRVEHMCGSAKRKMSRRFGKKRNSSDNIRPLSAHEKNVELEISRSLSSSRLSDCSGRSNNSTSNLSDSGSVASNASTGNQISKLSFSRSMTDFRFAEGPGGYEGQNLGSGGLASSRSMQSFAIMPGLAEEEDSGAASGSSVGGEAPRSTMMSRSSVQLKNEDPLGASLGNSIGSCGSVESTLQF